MPIPIGAHTVRGNPNRVELSSGEVVTRARALTLGAQERGYQSHYAYRPNSQRDKNYVNAFLRSEQGKEIRKTAKSNGMNRADLAQQIIAARNSRPSSKRGGGAAFYDFIEAYDLTDDREEFDIDY
jgi:hypothetical protein